MADFETIETLDTQIDALETSLSGAAGMAASFSSELASVGTALAQAGGDASKLETSLSNGVSKAFDQVITEGASLSDAFRTIATSLSNTALSSAVDPISDQVGGFVQQAVTGWFGGAFANGGAFNQGRVMPFAKGGVVSSPTAFPMKGATGLMGEAGPEAIMPLTRDAGGRLGVKAQGGSAPTQVVMNIQTTDAPSFERSQAQIAARMSRALSAGQRNR